MNAPDALLEGREAFARRAWAEACRRLSAADALAPLGVDDLERWATSADLSGSDELAEALWVRAHGECLRLHDSPRAVRCIFWLILDLLTRGELAPAGGWLSRAEHLLADVRRDGPERGLLLVLSARMRAGRGDLQSAWDAARQAAALADRFDDAELKVFGPLVLAQVHSRRGETADAAALFDEIMVAVTVGGVSPIAVGIVYCAVIDACRQSFDVARAREWTAALSRWCGAQPELVPFRGACLVHRTEIMRVSGAWSRAMAEAEHACAWLSDLVERRRGASDMPSRKYPIGAAFLELAELYRVRGRLAKAEQAYRQASRYGQSPEPGLALLRLAQGRPRVARTSIQRVLGQPQQRLTRARSLAACVDIMIAVRDLPAARAAAEELVSIAVESGAPLLRASSAQAMGAVLLAEGDARASLAELRTAWMTWQDLETPFEAARVRVLLGLACRDIGDEDAAELELDAARRVFQRLGAEPDLAYVDDLLAVTRRPRAPALTPRELQVIELVAAGRTNRAIAGQLSISERTVDRHVSNILMKLELSSRSAATAYAYEHGLV